MDYPDSTFKQITNTLAVNQKPSAFNVSYYSFISDKQGIDNLYVFNTEDTISRQVTSFAYGIQQHTIDERTRRLAFTSVYNSQDAIFLQSFRADQSRFSPTTPRRALEISKIVAARRKSQNGGAAH